MTNLLGVSSKKVGTRPGTIQYTGLSTDVPVTLSLFRYDEHSLDEQHDLTLEAALAAIDPARVNWLNINGLHNVELLAALGEANDLHLLTLEDVASVGQRPKIEYFDNYVFIVLRMLSLSAEQTLQNEQVSFLLSSGLLITFQERQGDVFDSVRERLRQKKGRIRTRGADYLCYALMDALVDTYFTLLETYGDRTEDLEEEILADPDPDQLERVNALRREALFMRKAVWPLREIIGSMTREESSFFSASVLTFLRDLHDHSVQIIDTVETLREILSSLHDAYMSSLSLKMNEVMKVLTIVGTIFIPLSFLVGVYGMNFDLMPELHIKWAYPALWVVMLSSVGGMLVYFRRKRWL